MEWMCTAGLGQFSSLIRDKNDKITFYNNTPTVGNQHFYCQEFNAKEFSNPVSMYFIYLTVLLIAFENRKSLSLWLLFKTITRDYYMGKLSAIIQN
jgi:hypothetical protein